MHKLVEFMVLIAGVWEKTENYRRTLDTLGIEYQVSLASTDVGLFDALLLPGGGDIDPARFGQENKGSRDIDPALDEAQFAVLDVFVREEKPILGICRGMQLLNVYFGGNVIQHLPTAARHEYRGSDQFHAVRNRPGSYMHAFFGDSATVNSAHHQGCGRIGQGFIVTQTAEDGVVEAIEHTALPILGVQWHPERMSLVHHNKKLAKNHDSH